jgi:hypothetical protein
VPHNDVMMHGTGAIGSIALLFAQAYALRRCPVISSCASLMRKLQVLRISIDPAPWIADSLVPPHCRSNRAEMP